MKGSDWLLEHAGAFSNEQEDSLVSSILNPSCRMPIRWVGVSVSYNDHKGVFVVAEDALSLGEPDDFFRCNFTYAASQHICDALGLVLPTSKMVDLVYSQAENVCEPRIQAPSAAMSSTNAMVKHSSDINRLLDGKGSGLTCNVGKWWVISKEAFALPSRAVNYGWFSNSSPYRSANGLRHVWQPVSTAHNFYHRDYSQVLVPVWKEMLVDGVVVPIEYVISNPELCRMISYDGPLSSMHHPGLRVWTPVGAVEPLTCDVASVRLSAGAPKSVHPPAPSDGKPICDFIQAKNYTKSAIRKIDLIVIHSMEAPEKPGTAVGVARWFAGASAPQASCHYALDNAKIVQCVLDMDVAWAAPGTNNNGIHLEHAGYAAQTPVDWEDDYSAAMLELSSTLSAYLAKKYSLPPSFVDAEGLLEGDLGFTTHAEVTKACKLAKDRGLTASKFFKAKSDHTDPGKWFPMDGYLAAVKAKMEG